jgi:hypothetical protein
MKVSKEQLRRQWDANRLIRIGLKDGRELVIAKGDFTDREVHFAVKRPKDRAPIDLKIVLEKHGLTWSPQLQSASFDDLFGLIESALHMLESHAENDKL